MSTASSAPATPALSGVPYLPGLDGMRALAVVAVMVYHANHEWLPGGFIGVEVFFVISGYLITLLLLGEHERSGHIDLRQFWLRRFRRLLPALITMLALLAIVMSLFFRSAQGRTRGDFIAGFPFYSSNWYQIWVGQGYTATESFVPLRHLWSLAVEEQFYLIWPLLMVVLLRRRNRAEQARLGIVFAGLSVFIAIVVAFLYAGGDVAGECTGTPTNGYFSLFGRCLSTNDALYLSSFSRASGILLGAALAMLWRPNAIVRGPLRDAGRRLDLLGIAGLGVLGVLAWRLNVQTPGTDFGSRYDPWLFRGGFLAIGLATVAVVMAATHRGALSGQVLGNEVFRWVGTRSYGLYLYHWPVYQIIRKEAGVLLSPAQFVLAMVITVPLTEASYRFVETPIRQGKLGAWLRGRIGNPQHRMVAASIAVVAIGAGVSIAAAENRCVGDVECSLEAARQIPDDGSSSSVVVPATDPPAPLTTNPASPSATEPGPDENDSTSTSSSTEPAAQRSYAMYGESVMAGAKASLVAGGGRVVAVEARQADTILAAVQADASSGKIGKATLVVIQAGTNGRVSESMYDSLVAAVDGAEVWFMTVYDPSRQSLIDANNERIRALPDKYPNVKVIEWAKLAPKVKLCKDKIHISCSGSAARAYAKLIFEAIGRDDLVPK